MRISVLFAGVLALSVSAAPAPETRKEKPITQTTPRIGGPHGLAFADDKLVDAAGGHKRISQVTMAPCTPTDHVTYIGFQFKDYKSPTHPTADSKHGLVALNAAGKPTASMTLEAGDYITEVNVRTWQKNLPFSWRTRVGHVSMKTKMGKTVACGAYGAEDPDFTMTAAKGEALLYFSGAAADGIDNLVGHFIKAVDY